MEGVHAGGDEGEVFGAEVVGLDAAAEFLILPADLGAEVFDFHLSHALHFREDFFARGGHWVHVSGFNKLFQIVGIVEDIADNDDFTTELLPPVLRWNAEQAAVGPSA